MSKKLAKAISQLEEVAELAKAHVRGYTRGDGTFVNEHDDKRAAKPKKAAKPLHHKDLKEGDELEGPDGEKHEYLSTHRGLGRMVIETRAGHKHPTEKDGTLPGWKKTGRNNAS